MKAVIFDLLRTTSVINRNIVSFCVKNSIVTEKDYNCFRTKHPYVRLKKSVYGYTGFHWKLVVDPDGKLFYRTFEDCRIALDKIIERGTGKERKMIKDNIKLRGYSNIYKFDKNIPPYGDLTFFYG